MIQISAVQSQQEAQLSHSLQEAEAEAASALLAAAQTEQQLIAVAENAAGFAEAATKKHLHPDSPPVACKSGCSWCCYQLVPVSVPETLRIASYLQDGSSSELAETLDRLRALDKITRGLTPQQRVSIPRPCAYLKDGHCSIYSVRPLACAEFTSYDVQVCKRGKRVGFKPNAVIHEKARMLVFYAVQRGLSEGLRNSIPKADCAPLELTAASLVALEISNVADAWLKGGKVFKSAHFPSSKKPGRLG